MKTSWRRFISVVQSLNAIRLIVEWFGLKAFLVSSAWSLALGIWGVLAGIPLPLMIAAGFCVFVAALYLAQVPAFLRAIERVEPTDVPNPVIWGHLERYNLAQASCLLADMTPTATIPPGDADGWYSVLFSAISAGELQHVPMPDDGDHTFSYAGGYRPHHGTIVTRSELRAFAEKRAVKPRFLFPDA